MMSFRTNTLPNTDISVLVRHSFRSVMKNTQKELGILAGIADFQAKINRTLHLWQCIFRNAFPVEERQIGALHFINTLLLQQNIESNPGPNKQKEEYQHQIENSSNCLESKSLVGSRNYVDSSGCAESATCVESTSFVEPATCLECSTCPGYMESFDSEGLELVNSLDHELFEDEDDAFKNSLKHKNTDSVDNGHYSESQNQDSNLNEMTSIDLDECHNLNVNILADEKCEWPHLKEDMQVFPVETLMESGYADFNSIHSHESSSSKHLFEPSISPSKSFTVGEISRHSQEYVSNMAHGSGLYKSYEDTQFSFDSGFTSFLSGRLSNSVVSDTGEMEHESICSWTVLPQKHLYTKELESVKSSNYVQEISKQRTENSSSKALLENSFFDSRSEFSDFSSGKISDIHCKTVGRNSLSARIEFLNLQFYIVDLTRQKMTITFHDIQYVRHVLYYSPLWRRSATTYCPVSSVVLLCIMQNLGLLQPREVYSQSVIVVPAMHGLGAYFQQVIEGPPLTLLQTMRYEWMRVRSFWSFPANSGVSSLQLARAGFFYTGRVSETCCYSCGRAYSEWQEGDDPHEVHRRISPNCPHLRGADQQNLPIYPDINEQWPAFRVQQGGDEQPGSQEMAAAGNQEESQREGQVPTASGGREPSCSGSNFSLTTDDQKHDDIQGPIANQEENISVSSSQYPHHGKRRKRNASPDLDETNLNLDSLECEDDEDDDEEIQQQIKKVDEVVHVVKGEKIPNLPFAVKPISENSLKQTTDPSLKSDTKETDSLGSQTKNQNSLSKSPSVASNIGNEVQTFGDATAQTGEMVHSFESNKAEESGRLPDRTETTAECVGGPDSSQATPVGQNDGEANTEDSSLQNEQGSLPGRTPEHEPTHEPGNVPAQAANREEGKVLGPQDLPPDSAPHAAPRSNDDALRGVPPAIPQPNRFRYPAYAVHATRADTFNNWPTRLNQTPYEMASAGFFYAGHGDYCRCFCCGGGLRNWERGDDPWVEHARWYPQCTFVLQNKGERFVRLIRERQEQQRQLNAGHPQEAAQQGNPPEPRDQLQGQAATGTQLNQTPNQSQENTSAQQQQGQQQSGKGQQQGQDQPEGQGQSGPRQPPVVEEMQLPAVLSMIDNGYNPRYIQQALELWKKKQKTPFDISDVTAASLLKICFKLEEEEEKRKTSLNSLEQLSLESLSDVASGAVGGEVSQGETISVPELDYSGPEETRLKSLHNENETMKKQLMCMVCEEKEVGVAFLPCGHLVCCHECALAMLRCPACSKPVKGSVKVFFP